MTSVQSLDDAMRISLAKTTDFEELTIIMDKANEYALDKSGEPIWGLREYALRELTAHLKAGECFVMRDDQKIAATMTITDEDRLWGEYGADDDALYFHKLMKDPQYPIRDVGLIFISFVANEASKRNKKFLRCDTISTQKRLINYYFKLGFVEKGSFTYRPSGRPGVFLEALTKEVIANLA
jgi:hypothetical protein